jgi:TRAP-type C4-dicarboxylate transport system permease small subunit
MVQERPGKLDALKRLHDFMAKLFAALSALTVAAMVGLIAFSSIMRYIVGKPFHFADELSALFFMALSVLPIAYVAKLKNHIRIRMIFDRIPQPARDWVALTAEVVTLALVVMVVKITWDFAYMTYEFGGRSADASLLLFPWMMLIPISFGMFGLSTVLDLIEQWQSIFRKR